jgi:hypothetical protein
LTVLLDFRIRDSPNYNSESLASRFGSLLICQHDREVEQGASQELVEEESTTDMEKSRSKFAVDNTYKRLVEILSSNVDSLWPQGMN